MRNKFDYVKELLQRNIVDILFLAETKIDETFVDVQFQVNDYMLWRTDRNIHWGGLAGYLRSSIAGDRNKQLDFKDIESIGIEIHCNNQKWFISGVYKPPTMPNQNFFSDLSSVVDKVTSQYDNFILIGDFNFDMSDKAKGSTISDL